MTGRPVPLSRVWSKRTIIAEDLAGDDLSDVLELHSDASAWWVLPRSSDYGAAELRSIAQALDLDEMAVHDLLAQDRRAKFEELGHAQLVITNAVAVDRAAAQVAVHPVSVVLTDRALICMVDDTQAFRPAQVLAEHEVELATGGVEVALRLVLSAIIDSYQEAVEWLEDASDVLADALFEERPLDKSEQLQAFRLRSALSQLRRLTEPMRAVVSDLLERQDGSTRPRTARNGFRQWRSLAERHTRVADAADSLREALASVFETSLALADARMNQIAKKLTGWAAVIAVPTLVTSFVGMNVHFPLVGTVLGFWVYLCAMVLAGFLLFLVFRAKDWV